ncbi:excisionase family DNA binding protein [Crossiella equi]|uniref:Excisionase family DNA binding protein n=1 Tax=Crossiella equi TaxID=130796 RepID=A0ABS5A403_9PSEU|nr:helix-turn-helix domain-containing protein [Crossiella equi]MBP2471299.1 excisionase family DNA binding protein [Crossiella equi]
MSNELYSVEHVAHVLGLHVKTVRGYVREGKLPAVRIGKQYRIARADLEAFTGSTAAPPARETAVRHRRAEVTSVVQVDAISFELMGKLSGMLTGSLQGRDPSEVPVRVQTFYDEQRASLRIVLIGPPGDIGKLLELTEVVLNQ